LSPHFLSHRVAAAGAIVGGACFAAAGALQATGLDWTENAVKTPVQHVTMALFSVALVAVVPALWALSRQVAGVARYAWLGIAGGQVAVAAASTVSNIRGVDASWFPAVAIAANAVWIAATLALAVGLYRTRRVPRLVAIGLVVAYVGAIPLGILGGGLVTGAYWLAIGYLLGLDALARRTLQPARIATMATLVLVIGAATAGVAQAGSAPTSLDLAVDGMHATRTLVDAPPLQHSRIPDDSPGDTIVLHAPLLDGKGTRVGMIDATFLTTAVGKNAEHDGSEQLTGTLQLPGGAISVLGTVGAFARVTHVAVIGGTGRYAGARGEVIAQFTQRAVKLHVQLT
jgi:hypothetical protein